jgi:hypothetical protein
MYVLYFLNINSPLLSFHFHISPLFHFPLFIYFPQIAAANKLGERAYFPIYGIQHCIPSVSLPLFDILSFRWIRSMFPHPTVRRVIFKEIHPPVCKSTRIRANDTN